MKQLIALFFSLFFVGCASVGGTLGNWEGAVGKMDYDLAAMPFEIGGQKYKGTAVIDRKSSQDILFFLPKDTIKLMVTTCNREKFFAYPDFNKTFKYTYIPIMFLENTDSCFMTVTAITKYGETFKSIIDFRAGETLVGHLACNGEETKEVGTGFCQSRDGLVQRIEFSFPVVGVSQDGCPALNEVSNNSFEFKMAPGFCTYKFADQKKEKFRLTTFGYTRIREVSEVPVSK
jgi:hypothetical protein